MTVRENPRQSTNADEAQESPVPGDSKVEQGPSMGEHCVSDRPTPSGELPTGEVTKIGGIDVYVTKPNDYPHTPSKLLLFFTSGTGLSSTNNQLQADKFAAGGFVVVMPDLFEGDPAPNPPVPSEESTSSIEEVKLKMAEAAKSFRIDMWMARHTPEKILPIVFKVLDAAKDEFSDAVANGGGVYAVGYCFGGKYVMLLSGEDPRSINEVRAPNDEEQGIAKSGPLIKAGALAHASDATRTEIERISAPVSMVCVENDPLFPDEILEAGRKALQERRTEHEIETYSNVPHGFAVLGDYPGQEYIMKEQERAFDQMFRWLKSH